MTYDQQAASSSVDVEALRARLHGMRTPGEHILCALDLIPDLFAALERAQQEIAELRAENERTAKLIERISMGTIKSGQAQRGQGR